MTNTNGKSSRRFFFYGLLILLAVGAVVGYKLYQNRQANMKAAEGFQKQAEMLEKMRGK